MAVLLRAYLVIEPGQRARRLGPNTAPNGPDDGMTDRQNIASLQGFLAQNRPFEV